MDQALWQVIDELKSEKLGEFELRRIMNKIRTSKEFQDQGLLQRAMHLCIYELLGDADKINHESDEYAAIHPDDIQRVSIDILAKNNCSLLKIKSISNDQ